ncbi:hypothetical protein BDN72DRAFT_965387 [Pluteus cervinus]|uniref:Uncharacterized protein n=1 Tax=Pluteus cervinus TaxID=181527 RepID=A0ACD3A653_9AGAR|nr:hypothetical protein BDN72DRAFT_965387 [Pluteus cervinus]
MSDETEPIFPPEIEEYIFSIAVHTDWNCAKRLVFVAKRVHEWIIPQIYEVVNFYHLVIPGERPKATSGNLIQYGKHVRRLMLHHNLRPGESPRISEPNTGLHHSLGECLSWCPNVVDVALWVTEEQFDDVLVNQLLSLRLTHLSFDIGAFESVVPNHTGRSPPVSFEHVTHLELTGVDVRPVPQEMKKTFPSLAHLSLSGECSPISLLNEVLDCWKDQLKTLIWYLGESDSGPMVIPTATYKSEHEASNLMDDPRIVIFQDGRDCVETWYESSKGGLDMWLIADEAVSSRASAVVTAHPVSAFGIMRGPNLVIRLHTTEGLADYFECFTSMVHGSFLAILTTTMADVPQPVFPPELEELIFALALQDNLDIAGTLLFVAKRVHDWVFPHFYRVVIFQYARETHTPHRKLSLRSLIDNGKHVHHLLLHNGAPGLEDKFSTCIERCPNLRSLALWISDNPYSPELVQSLLRLQLEYLSFDIHGFTAALKKQGTPPVPFPTVTHVEIIGSIPIVDPRLIKVYFPALTHLAITSLGRTPVTILQDALDIFGDQLKVAIWYLWRYGEGESPPSVNRISKENDMIDDPRFVVVSYGSSFVDTWHEGVKGGLGIWKAAEGAVEARRRVGAIGE